MHIYGSYPILYLSFSKHRYGSFIQSFICPFPIKDLALLSSPLFVLSQAQTWLLSSPLLSISGQRFGSYPVIYFVLFQAHIWLLSSLFFVHSRHRFGSYPVLYLSFSMHKFGSFLSPLFVLFQEQILVLIQFFICPFPCTDLALFQSLIFLFPSTDLALISSPLFVLFQAQIWL